MRFCSFINHCFDKWSIHILVGRHRVEAIGIGTVYFFYRLHFLSILLCLPSCSARETIIIGITSCIRVFIAIIVAITTITSVTAIAFVNSSLGSPTTFLYVFKFLGVIIKFVATAVPCGTSATTITATCIRVDMLS